MGETGHSTKKVLRSLDQMIARGEKLRADGCGYDAAMKWHRAAMDLVAEVWGKDHDNFRGLNRISFSIGITVVGPGVDSERNSADEERWLLHGLDQAVAVLRDISQSVRSYGLPAELTRKRSVLRNAILAIITTVIASVVTYFIINALSTPEQSSDVPSSVNESTQETAEAKAAVIFVDLKNWWERDNESFETSLDSLVKVREGNSRYWSGATFKAIIDFCEARRRARDRTVDSFAVRLQVLGVEPGSLRTVRKLPFRVGQRIKPWLVKMDIDEPRVDRIVFGLDTL